MQYRIFHGLICLCQVEQIFHPVGVYSFFSSTWSLQISNRHSAKYLMCLALQPLISGKDSNLALGCKNCWGEACQSCLRSHSFLLLLLQVLLQDLVIEQFAPSILISRPPKFDGKIKANINTRYGTTHSANIHPPLLALWKSNAWLGKSQYVLSQLPAT